MTTASLDISAKPDQTTIPGQRVANALRVALVAVMFSLPVCTGTALLHYVFYLVFFVLFALTTFFCTRQAGFSLLRELKQTQPLVFFLLLGFALASLISVLKIMTGDYEQFRQFMAVSRYIFYVIVGMYVFALVRLCRIFHWRGSDLFIAHMAGTVLLALLFFLSYRYVDAYGAKWWGIDPPFGRHVRLIGMGAAVAAVTGMTVFLFRQGGWLAKLLVWSGMLVCNAFLIWTGSRTSLLLVLLFSVALMVIMVFFRKNILLPLILLAGIALSFGLASKVSIFPWSGLQRSIKVTTVEVPVKALNDEGAIYRVADKLSSGRLAIWGAALDAWKEAPWFGQGPNSTIFVLKYSNTIDQPHNFILQFMLEWGVIGAMLLLALLFSLCWISGKKMPAALRNADVEYLLPVGIVLLLFLNGLTDGPFYHVQTLLCFATAMAFLPESSRLAGKKL